MRSVFVVKTPGLCYHSAGENVMRRTDTLWQIMVLLLIFLMTAGIYACLATLLLRLRDRAPAVSVEPTPTELSRSAGVVQILEPLGGSAIRRDTVPRVRAAVLEEGFLQADLEVDGQSAGIRINLDPASAPWFVEWDWQDAAEGSHTLVVRAGDERNVWVASEPVTITVVPVGRLIFASNRDGAYVLYAMDTDGRGLERLTTGPGTARQPAPGPDGRLAYVTETGDGQRVIRLREAEGREMDLAAGWDPAWLRPAEPQAGSAWLAYTSSLEGLSQILVLEFPSRTAGPVTAEEVYAGQPNWSSLADPQDDAGQKLAYVAEREGNWDIWLTSPYASPGSGDAAGAGALRLTDDPAMDWAPAWSPDGTQIAFVSDRGGSHQVYVMRADGAELRPVTGLSQGAESPAWSPDGFWLAVVTYSGEGSGIDRREIYLVRADGRGTVRLTHNAFDDTDVAWIWEP